MRNNDSAFTVSDIVTDPTSTDEGVPAPSATAEAVSDDNNAIENLPVILVAVAIVITVVLVIALYVYYRIASKRRAQTDNDYSTQPYEYDPTSGMAYSEYEPGYVVNVCWLSKTCYYK